MIMQKFSGHCLSLGGDVGAHSGEGTIGEVKSLEQVSYLYERLFQKGRALVQDF